MAKQYKCSCCMLVPVASPGQICPACLAKQNSSDPFGFGFPTSSAQQSMPEFNVQPTPDDPFGAQMTPENPFGTQQTSMDPFAANSAPMNPYANTHSRPARRSTRRSASKGVPRSFTGRVQSVNSYEENPKGLFMRRWFGSCFSGAAFSTQPCVITMQVGVSSYEAHSGTAKQVVVYAAKEDRMVFQPGNNVTVFGHKGGNGRIYATSIVNESTQMNISGGTSPWVVRIIMMLLLGICAFLCMTNNISVQGLFGNWEEKIGTLIGGLIIALLFFFMLKNNPRLRKLALFIMAFLLVSMINPVIGTMILIVMGIWIMMGGMHR